MRVKIKLPPEVGNPSISPEDYNSSAASHRNIPALDGNGESVLSNADNVKDEQDESPEMKEATKEEQKTIIDEINWEGTPKGTGWIKTNSSNNARNI